jgi:glucose-6-phosphate-specific signal transduction histidine kinase
MTLQSAQRAGLESRFHWQHRRTVLLALLGLSVIVNVILATQFVLDSAETSIFGLDTRVVGGVVLVLLSMLLAFHFYQQKRMAEIRLEFMTSQAEGLQIQAELARSGQSKMTSH